MRGIWQSQRQLSCTSQGTFNIKLWIFLTQAGEMSLQAVCLIFSSSYVGNLKGTSKPMHSQNPSTHFWNSWHWNDFNLHYMSLHILNLSSAWLGHAFLSKQTHPFFFFYLSRVVHEALGQPPENILHLGGDCLWEQGNQIVFLCHFGSYQLLVFTSFLSFMFDLLLHFEHIVSQLFDRLSDVIVILKISLHTHDHHNPW